MIAFLIVTNFYLAMFAVIAIVGWDNEHQGEDKVQWGVPWILLFYPLLPFYIVAMMLVDWQFLRKVFANSKDQIK